MQMDVYKSSSAAAESAAESVRDALRALGIPEMEVKSIRPHVLTGGRPVVTLGIWRLDVVEKIAAALQLGAAVAQTPGAEVSEST